MSRIRTLVAGLFVAGFAAGCIDMEDEVFVEDDVAYLEPGDEVYTPDEPLRAELPADPDDGDIAQPDATFLETEGEFQAPTEPLRIQPPGDDDDDDVTDEGTIFEPNQRRQ